MKQILTTLLLLLALVSCKSPDITLDEAYNEMIHEAYIQDEDSLAYYRELVTDLRQTYSKTDTVLTTIHDSVFIEREGLSTNTYKYHSEIIYRTSTEALTYISTLTDSLSYYKSYSTYLSDSISNINQTTKTQIKYLTPWYWKLLGIIGIIFLLLLAACAAGAASVELKEYIRRNRQ